jgi:hypothetical protein
MALFDLRPLMALFDLALFDLLCSTFCSTSALFDLSVRPALFDLY